MNAQSITDKIHQRSDAELKKLIEAAVMPLFEECRNMPYGDLSRAYPDDWKDFKDNHWIGHYMQKYRDLAFLYLRDYHRAKAVDEFVRKVEEVHTIAEEFQQ